MHDPNAPGPDETNTGEPEEAPPGALLFDPRPPIPLDEMDAYGYEEEKASRLPQIVFGMLAHHRARVPGPSS